MTVAPTPPPPPSSRRSLMTILTVVYLPPRFRFERGHRGRAVGKEPTEFPVNGSTRNTSEHGGTLPRHRLLVLGLKMIRVNHTKAQVNQRPAGSSKSASCGTCILLSCVRYHYCIPVKNALVENAIVHVCSIATTCADGSFASKL